jgi:hypothetical protein
MKKLILILFLFMMFGLVVAHQPRVGFDAGTLESPIEVEKPEISKAYYRELEGGPEYYEINSDQDFLLYLNILTPDIEGARKDFIVEVFQNNEVIFTLNNNNNNNNWGEFYEPFGGDNYLKGPELEKQANAGTYLIKVSNPDNLGKYSLAVGKIESFPPIEIIKTIFSLPKIKKDFFNKSPLTAYFNLSGLFFLILLIILSGLIFLIRSFIKKYKTKKK